MNLSALHVNSTPIKIVKDFIGQKLKNYKL